MTYPPEFMIQPDGAAVVMTCLECGVHVSAPNFTLERLEIEASAHTNYHLSQGMKGKHND